MTDTRLVHLPPTSSVEVWGSEVRLDGIVVDDAVLAEYLAAIQSEGRESELAKILAVGVRGLTTMGAGATVKGVGEEVERALRLVTDEAEARVRGIIEAGRETLAGSLDPDVRSSVTARTLEDISGIHDDLLARLDPDRADSHTARLIAEMTSMLGPGGVLAQSLAATLDPGGGDSAVGRLMTTLDSRFRDLRDLIVGEAGRQLESERGTAKGVEYEDCVVADLRGVAGEIGGCTVEATGDKVGTVTASAKVGDAVLTLPSGTRIVIEAKNAAGVTLTGKKGILEELDRAMANRDAAWGICLSAEDAFPAEVGCFAVYDNRVLVVDDGDGILLRVAVRWIRAATDLAAAADSSVDAETVGAALARLKGLAQRFTGAKRALTTVRSGVDQVRTELDGLRTDLVDLVDDLHHAVRRSHRNSRSAAG